jgi:hypothetical protein
MSTGSQPSRSRNCGVVPLAALLASVGLSACSGNTAHPAPPTPDPDQAAGIVSRFYRDVASGGLGAMTDVRSIVSSAFYQRHASQWNAQYGFITDPRITIHSVRGRTVNYTLDYETPLNGWRLFSRRSGGWNLVYVNNRWLLDSDLWRWNHVVAIRDGYGRIVTVHENVDPVGRREFVYNGYIYTLHAGGWRGVATASAPVYPGYAAGHIASGAGSFATRHVARVQVGETPHRAAGRTGDAMNQKREKPRR